MSQQLGLHGCKWRELSGQACFLALAFLCYQFLAWVQLHGGLSRYGVERGTLGLTREAFVNYCQEQFAEWLADIKQQCESCGPANWIYDHVFGGGKES